MKEGSDITNLTGFKEVLNQHLALLKFLLYYFKGRITSGRNFFKIKFASSDSKIKEIYAIRSVLKNFAEFYFCDWLLRLLDFHYRLTPDSFSNKLIFVKKASTYFLKLSRRIFSYFSKIKTKKLKQVFRVPQKQLFTVKYFCKKLHHRCYTGFLIRH